MDSASSATSDTSSSSSSTPAQKQIRLVDSVVSNQNEALQLMVSFLNLAQRRVVFTIDESDKIWECVKYFQ